MRMRMRDKDESEAKTKTRVRQGQRQVSSRVVLKVHGVVFRTQDNIVHKRIKTYSTQHSACTSDPMTVQSWRISSLWSRS